MRNIKLTLITVFFIAFNINNAQSKGQYDSLRALMTMTKQRTVPQIYIYGQHVGGYDDLRAKDALGLIDSLLEKK